MHTRKSTRLQNYDYSQNGYYFVTICAHENKHIFGNLVGAGPRAGPELNQFGLMVKSIWLNIPKFYPNIDIDEFIIMPNHFHGIVVIENAGTGGVTPPLRKTTLPMIMGYFKYHTTKQINILLNNPGQKIWQRGYYDHVIRNEYSLFYIREYIKNNPIKLTDRKLQSVNLPD